MPITCPVRFDDLSRDDFMERDHLVMGCAFATHNRLGRLCDEYVYENKLKEELYALNVKYVLTQVPVFVTYKQFSKRYRIDLVVDHAVYELKTVTQLTNEHLSQALHYAMLLNVRCIKLLNFRNAKVEGKIQFCAICSESRFRYSIDSAQWIERTRNCELLRLSMLEILSEFGAFLEVPLYTEALCALCGSVQARLDIRCDGKKLGTQNVNLIADQIAFFVTAHTDSLEYQRSHFGRLLELLPLRTIHWINLNRHFVSLITIEK